MREIKFRGLTKEGKWVYGYYTNSFWDNAWIWDATKDVTAQIRTEVFPETVGQYTELKDKNGREIYEGDIVIWCGSKWWIKFVDGSFGFCHQPDDEYLHDRDLGIECFHKAVEVIGNIHENPELLSTTDKKPQ